MFFNFDGLYLKRSLKITTQVRIKTISGSNSPPFSNWKIVDWFFSLHSLQGRTVYSHDDRRSFQLGLRTYRRSGQSIRQKLGIREKLGRLIRQKLDCEKLRNRKKMGLDKVSIRTLFWISFFLIKKNPHEEKCHFFVSPYKQLNNNANKSSPPPPPWFVQLKDNWRNES